MQHGRLCILLATLVVLTACQVPTVTRASSGRSKPRMTQTSQASPTPSTTASALRFLQKPAGAVATLKGKVTIDAHYVLQRGKGVLIGQAGSNVIGAGGGNLIGQAGSNAIILDGSPLIGQAGSNVIGAGGGNIIGQAGSNVIGAGGGNLIGQAGSNVIGAGGGNFRVFGFGALQAPETPQLSVGTTLPAGGMELEVHSLTTGKPLTLGVTDAGEPVHTVFTDTEGNYELYLPESERQNVTIVARPHVLDDPRLLYRFLQQPSETELGSIDEDTALTASYLQTAFDSRLLIVFNDFEKDSGVLFGEGDIGGLGPIQRLFEPMLATVRDALVDGRVSELTPEQRKARARHLTNVLLARVPLTQIQTADFKNTGHAPRPAMEVLTAALRISRTYAAHVMNEKVAERGSDGGYPIRAFFDLTVFDPATEEVVSPALREFRVHRPSDLGEFYKQAVFSNEELRNKDTFGKLLKASGATDEDVAIFNNALDGFLLRLIMMLATNEGAAEHGTGALDRAVEVIKTGV